VHGGKELGWNCVLILVGKLRLIYSLTTFMGYATGRRVRGRLNVPPVQRSILANLANDCGQMQQAGVILSIALCRGVQVEKTLNTDFWISARGRSYTPAKFYTFRNFEIWAIFGQIWCAIARSLIKVGGRVIPRWNRLSEMKKTPFTERV